MNGKMKRIFGMIMSLILVSGMIIGCAEEVYIEPGQEKTPVEKTDQKEEEKEAKEEKKEEEKEVEAEEEEEEGDQDLQQEVKNSVIIDIEGLSGAVNSFNWRYFDIQDTKKNLFYSPLSLAEALSMALYGADTDTEKELKEVLNIKDTDTFLSDLNLFAGEDYGSENKLIIANSLWADSSFASGKAINEDFMKGLEQKLGAELKTVDFSGDSDGASKEITDWVNEKTEGFISDYSCTADENTVLDIINAIYFNGKWEEEFMKDDTFEETFRGQTEAPADMMHMYDIRFNYIERDGFKGIELPYKDSSLVMDIILPADDGDKDAGKKWAELKDADKDGFLSELSDSDGEKVNIIAIPKFEMDITAENLKEDLVKMGIKTAFDPSAADFSKIAEDMYISDIAHRAKIELDEEGSRAAAVTEIEMAVTAVGPIEEIREFICDRPFVYVIKDTETGVILFTGLVNEV